MADNRRDPPSAEQMKNDIGTKLFDLCRAIAEDGKISLDEIKSLRRWLRQHRGVDLPAIRSLSEIVERIVADRVVTSAERSELLSAIESVLDVPESDESIEASCDECGRKYRAAQTLSGQLLRCPKCGGGVIVPVVGAVADDPLGLGEFTDHPQAGTSSDPSGPTTLPNTTVSLSRAEKTGGLTAVAPSIVVYFLVAASLAVAGFWLTKTPGKWPTTSGVISKCRSTERVSRDFRGNSGRKYWVHVVTYTYDVGGKSYSCQSGVGRRYFRGNDVTVQYNPRNPSQATLRGMPKPKTTSSLFGSIVLVAAVICCGAGVWTLGLVLLGKRADSIPTLLRRAFELYRPPP